MYQAKDAGRDSVAVFDESMRAKVSERVELENDLRHAVELAPAPPRLPADRPAAARADRRASRRWCAGPIRPSGVIPPVKFIPLAEENGLIVEIGTWVLEEALRQLAAWRRQGPHMATSTSS